MSFIISSKTIFPKNNYNQNEMIDFLATIWPKKKKLVSKFSKNVCVSNRALCLEKKDILNLGSFANRNKIWKEKAVPLMEESILEVLKKSGLEVRDINQFITTSVTGFCIPSIDTIMMNKLDFNENTKRLPLFGFGCLGGVASLNRAHEYLRLNPEHAVLISVY